MQKVELRQVLKWTNVYGYYLPEDKHAKKQFCVLEGDYMSHFVLLHLRAICNAG